MRAVLPCSVLLGVLCVVNLTSARYDKACFLPKKTGWCKAAFERYYYNKREGRCAYFIYGGCRGNANNFKTIEECNNKCGGRPAPVVEPISICLEDKKVGPCRASKTRYFYNKDTRRCEMFKWGGCRENGNNFESMALCRIRCGG